MFIVNVEAAIYREGKWLIIERSQQEEHAGGTLALVGGKAEREGTVPDILEKTIAREVMEEVGLALSGTPHVNSSSFVTDRGEAVVDIVFLCECESGEPRIASPEEVTAVCWMTAEEVLRHPLSKVNAQLGHNATEQARN
ncbi:NUDIX domain-containing protein [Paenibacillus thiaminolyticus]|uniref:NUDIX hydrolase n=1 Tax=Paenibacillus thiaminolyticus TaxID=49283 RepID=UPI0011643103|nr:NUDIX domain-containing protein [Paenibacillus thiaminolyticus]NGP58042.1 NUDIX domain-containing protein [Paenibacillus thiaminolyticus]